MRTKTLQIGITSLLGNGKHVMLLESDNEFDIQLFTIDFVYWFGIDHHITIYKSNKGYHMISLNQLEYYDLLHFCIYILQDDMVCNKQLGFAIRQEAFTLRITEKNKIEMENTTQFRFMIEHDLITFPPKEIIYHQWGSLPISKPHYEVFKLFLNNPEFDITYNTKIHLYKERLYDDIFFDHGYELKGYAWEE